MRPIILIEEPEAHLHPMTLASVWSLLELFNTQKIITTQSGTLLAGAALTDVRRLVRDPRGDVHEQRVRRDAMSSDELRRVSYHLRARRSVACFARVWLLVEGETEFWVLPDLARLCGYDMAQEGIVCVEFAQCGLAPLIKLAKNLGIEWHVLTDGDRQGEVYANATQPFLRGSNRRLRLTRLAELDIEHCFWDHGYAGLFEDLANMRAHGNVKPSQVIRKALDRHSKPGVALELLAAVSARGKDGPPPPLRTAIETCVRLARGAGSVDARPGVGLTPGARTRPGASPRPRVSPHAKELVP
jgi:putative ATP-dependent endonuclease of OLD family